MTPAPLRAVVAMDSFKGSVGSRQAGEAVAEGIRQTRADAVVTVLEVADGGEGTVEALRDVDGARLAAVDGMTVAGTRVEVPYIVMGDTVVIESATVIGLPMLGHDAHGRVDADSPRAATSQPLGALIRAVIERERPNRVMIGLGGTGTTDGGTGMIVGLGGTLRDALGESIDPARGNPLLQGVVSVDLPDLGDVALAALTDVRSPLRGPTGAARMFGPQKGATPSMVESLESAMRVWRDALNPSVADLPGAGAAGGVGAALAAVGGRLINGAQWVLETAGGDYWAQTDLVFTGEGRIDSQSAMGKVPSGVAAVARRHGAPAVVALGGAVSTRSLEGIDAILPIHTQPRPLSEAMQPQVTLAALRHTAAQATALFSLSSAR